MKPINKLTFFFVHLMNFNKEYKKHLADVEAVKLFNTRKMNFDPVRPLLVCPNCCDKLSELIERLQKHNPDALCFHLNEANYFKVASLLHAGNWQGIYDFCGKVFLSELMHDFSNEDDFKEAAIIRDIINANEKQAKTQ